MVSGVADKESGLEARTDVGEGWVEKKEKKSSTLVSVRYLSCL